MLISILDSFSEISFQNIFCEIYNYSKEDNKYNRQVRAEFFIFPHKK
jgi:hypothetical protein